MNPEEILTLLPQRPPFLFVDDVVELTADHVTTTYRADPKATFFSGHFPGYPVMPGVLQCECCLQAGAVLLTRRLQEQRVPPVTNRCHTHRRRPGGTMQAKGLRYMPVVTRIIEAKFKRLVMPGDLLAIHVQLDEELGGAYFMTGKVTVNDQLSTRLQFAVTLSPRERPAQ